MNGWMDTGHDTCVLSPSAFIRKQKGLWWGRWHALGAAHARLWWGRWHALGAAHARYAFAETTAPVAGPRHVQSAH
eukprot:28480-Chlamydomonas_euryale.AAC.1